MSLRSKARTVAGLMRAFRDSIADYLTFCSERGEELEKPYSGRFVTRVSPDLHRRLSIAAKLSGKSLNAWVTEQLVKFFRDNLTTETQRHRENGWT